MSHSGDGAVVNTRECSISAMLIVHSVITSPALPHPNDISTLHRKKLHSLLIEGAAADSSRPLISSHH